jgi:hypothetical protein
MCLHKAGEPKSHRLGGQTGLSLWTRGLSKLQILQRLAGKAHWPSLSRFTQISSFQITFPQHSVGSLVFIPLRSDLTRTLTDANIAGAQLAPNTSPTTDGAIWNVPCDTAFNLTFSFGGSQFLMNQSDLVVPNRTSGIGCQSTVRSWNYSEYLLGSAFIRNVYMYESFLFCRPSWDYN